MRCADITRGGCRHPGDRPGREVGQLQPTYKKGLRIITREPMTSTSNVDAQLGNRRHTARRDVVSPTAAGADHLVPFDGSGTEKRSTPDACGIDREDAPAHVEQRDREMVELHGHSALGRYLRHAHYFNKP